MKIAIVGAGVVGVTTAYELACQGHEVTVFERRASAAEEASYAPGALLGPALLSPWAAPGAMGVPSALGSAANVELGSGTRLPHMRWLWQWRTAARAAARSSEPSPALRALAQLSQLSQRCFAQTSEALELVLEGSAGALLLLRDERTAAPLRGTVEALRDAGVPLNELDADGARAVEPGLADSEPFTMALHLPTAEAGNCRQYAVLLRQAAQRLGVEFVFNAEVAAVRSVGGRAEMRLSGNAPTQTVDAVVMCSGMDAQSLLEPLGIDLGMVALWGTSLTAPLREDAGQPQGTVIDVARQVSLSRMGQRIRIAGGAALGNGAANAQSHTHQTQALNRLYEALDAWFPGSASRGESMQVWRGARPMRSGGLPALGASGVPGIWVNTGHGDSGWALASGCARVLADAMSERPCVLGNEVLTHFAVRGG